MPLEINEIAINMQVADATGEPRQRPAEPETAEPAAGQLDREELVRECVRRVLRVLKVGEER